MPIGPSLLLLPAHIQLTKLSNSKINKLIAWRTTWILKINEVRSKVFQAKRLRKRIKTSFKKMLMSCPEWRAQPIAATSSVPMLKIAKLPHSWFFQPLTVKAILLTLANTYQLKQLIMNQLRLKTWRIRSQLLPLAGLTRQTLEAALNSKDRGNSGHRSHRSSLWATSWRTWSRRIRSKVSRSLRKC